MAKGPYTLTPAEVEIIKRGAEDPNIITGYWFARPGREQGFQFDYNFEEPGKWQLKMHTAAQSLVCVIGGVGTGKTLAVGMSAVVWALTTESFKFLNVAQKAWQAHIMWQLIMEWAQGTRFEKLIIKAIERPYPKIVIGFKVNDTIYQSTLEFMSVADDAMGIFSWRGDKVNIEEAGHIDTLEEVVKNLSTRLTGSTPNGRPYFAQMILISNPWDNPHLWALFDLAREDPDNNLSISISTRHNKNVPDKQIQDMLKHIPESERTRFLDGTRPEGRGKFFAPAKVYRCENDTDGEAIEFYANREVPGYRLLHSNKTGVFEFTTPPEPNTNYIILGDPGTDNAPRRNSPVIAVWRIPEDFPETPMELKAFWWGSGNGQILPFVEKLLAWSGIQSPSAEFFNTLDTPEPVYNPIFVGIDSTGTQKNFAELLNLQILSDELSETEKIAPVGQKVIGLDFSGSKKPTYLLSLRLFVENVLIKWPRSVSGIRQQLLNYDPQLDRGGFPKQPQDIVATFAMSAFTARILYNVEDTKLMPKTLPFSTQTKPETSRTRRPSPQIRHKHRRRTLSAPTESIQEGKTLIVPQPLRYRP